MILSSNPKDQYLTHKARIKEAIERVLESGRYLMGEELSSFETEFSSFIGARYGIGVSSGTDALRLSLKAANVGPGDEVITVSHTAPATVAAIEMIGAVPVLVDIQSGTFTLDPRLLPEALSSRTKAIVPVHLYGQPADMDAIVDFAREHGLRVIEDCAQAPGATWRDQYVGTLGDAGCFSFYPTKNLGALGDAGMVVTDDSALAERIRALREYGWADNRISRYPGVNARMDEIQAAILRAKLPDLPSENRIRNEVAKFYSKTLERTPLQLPGVRGHATHVYHLYVVRSTRRDALKRSLKEHGILCGVHYPVPVHLQPAYQPLLPAELSLPETERAAREVLSLPIYPELGEEQLVRITGAVAEFFSRDNGGGE